MIAVHAGDVLPLIRAYSSLIFNSIASVSKILTVIGMTRNNLNDLADSCHIYAFPSFACPMAFFLI